MRRRLRAHPPDHRCHIARANARPAAQVVGGLGAGEAPGRAEGGEVLSDEEADAHVGVLGVAGDVRDAARVDDAVVPGEVEVRDEQGAAAQRAHAGLDGHEHAGPLAVAADAAAREELDAGDGAAPEAHVLGERPGGEEREEPRPELAIVLEVEPDAALCGLELDEREEAVGSGVGEE